jgi:type IV secretory pathway VirB2 component (pilin)
VTVGYQASLFDAPPEPALGAGSGWLTGLLGGSLAVSLCVIAMALLGMLMLTGRLHLRRGAQVMMGCFLLLGSSALAGEIAGFGQGDLPAREFTIIPPPLVAEPSLPPVTEDPYSGASLRRNRSAPN